MSRLQVALVLWLGVLPTALAAQVELTVRGGVHVDRTPEHDRVVTERGAAMYAGSGEASAFGAQVAWWHRPALGFEFDVSRSSNSSWSGSTPLPPPPFANRTTYLSARVVVRTSPAGAIQGALAAGPAAMLYGGTGTNLRTRDVDLGGVLEASARVRLIHHLAFELAVSNYFYGSSYVAEGTEIVLQDQRGTARSLFRHDVLVLPGLVYTWR